MIHLAYATHNKQGTKVNGHRARMVAVSEYLDDYTLLSTNANQPQYSVGDMLIIDSECDDYNHLLSPNVYSVLISDEYGMTYRDYPTNLVWYVSDGMYGLRADRISQMIYTVGKDVIRNSWEGGNHILFIPGSSGSTFYPKATKFRDYCFDNNLRMVFNMGRTEHKDLMELAIKSKYVVTASGVTAKEMIYMGVPCILILTADNQLGNYVAFTERFAYGQDSDPSVLSDDNALTYLSKLMKKSNMNGIPHMLNIIKTKHEHWKSK